MLVDQIKATHTTLGTALSDENFERAILLLKVLKELLQARKLEIELEKLEPAMYMKKEVELKTKDFKIL